VVPVPVRAALDVVERVLTAVPRALLTVVGRLMLVDLERSTLTFTLLYLGAYTLFGR